jgi:hypothetical protein
MTKVKVASITLEDCCRLELVRDATKTYDVSYCFQSIFQSEDIVCDTKLWV